MSETVIRVANLGKRYKLGLVHHDRLADALTAGLHWAGHGIRRLFSRNGHPAPAPAVSSPVVSSPVVTSPAVSGQSSVVRGPSSPVSSPSSVVSSPDSIWALRNVSFEVKRGQVVGIIGRNGAGKSTLLKILTGITEPTEGRAWIKGRIASLLEVGTGFHPELTGRENIFFNGAILGMSRAETRRKLDEIVAFAEIERFIDTPVKRYSSGMYVRLAFAVAAHLEPEILIVDEVLAVGDVQFQRKCLGKMQEVSRGLGRTVLFVSHNMTAVRTLCSRAIHLDSGQAVGDGPAGEVVHRYLEATLSGGLAQERDLCNWGNRYGSGELRILTARLLDEHGSPTGVLYRTRPATVEFEFEGDCPSRLCLSAVCFTHDGIQVLHLSHHDTPGFDPGIVRGKAKARFHIPALPLCCGAYSWRLAILTEFLLPVDIVTDVLPFRTEDIPNSPRPYRSVNEHGLCYVAAEWSLKRL